LAANVVSHPASWLASSLSGGKQLLLAKDMVGAFFRCHSESMAIIRPNIHAGRPFENGLQRINGNNSAKYSHRHSETMAIIPPPFLLASRPAKVLDLEIQNFFWPHDSQKFWISKSKTFVNRHATKPIGQTSHATHWLLKQSNLSNQSKQTDNQTTKQPNNQPKANRQP
jgi:hypothetical protein